MGYPKCALCGRGIKGRKRWLSQCFGGRKFPKLTVLRKHLPLSLAALLPGGGRPVMPKEPCLHDGSRGSATGCYAALLEAWPEFPCACVSVDLGSLRGWARRLYVLGDVADAADDRRCVA